MDALTEIWPDTCLICGGWCDRHEFLRDAIVFQNFVDLSQVERADNNNDNDNYIFI